MTQDISEAVVERVAKAVYARSPQLGFHDGRALSWEHAAEPLRDEATDQARAALEASGVQELVGALEPFAAFSCPGASDCLAITMGSPFAQRQLTAGDCRKAAAALARHRGDQP